MTGKTINDDLIDLARQEVAKGRMGRRDFVRLCLAAGIAPVAASSGLFSAREALAQANEIVLANFGGDAVKAMGEAWGEPFTADTGTPVIVDGATPLAGKIKAMVESGNVVWDVCDGDGFLCNQLGFEDLLDEVDYSIVDKSMVRDGWAYQHGIANYTYSFVLAYDKTLFPDRPPTYKDFFDTKTYPGKRTMWKYQMGAMEACLLADGVPPEELYPADVDRAIAKAKTLGDDLIFWESGASSQQMLMTGEVVMGNIWNTRSSVLERDTDGRITWTWNDGLFCHSSFVMPKGHKAGAEITNKFLASSLIPERQIELLKLLGNGPSNPAASAMLKGDLVRIDPGHPENVAKQVTRSEAWYEKNYDDALAKWLDGISS